MRSSTKKSARYILELRHVSKTYLLGTEVVHAVKDISFQVKPEEYVGIRGASGSGKSTLMYLIGLLESPSSGKIILAGQDVSRLSDKNLSYLRNQSIGFVFQSFNLINKLSVAENILLPVKYTPRALDFNPFTRAEELMQKFGIYDRRHFYPNKISGGQQQRTAIARALIMNPKIILADEPTGNLDTQTGNDILRLMESLNHEFHTTVIIVTHELDVAKRTKRQIFMQDGQIIHPKL